MRRLSHLLSGLSAVALLTASALPALAGGTLRLAPGFADDISQRAKREAMQRQITGAKSRPDISLRKSKTFLTDEAGIHGVVILRVSGHTKAVAIRAERIHERFRITEVLII